MILWQSGDLKKKNVHCLYKNIILKVLAQNQDDQMPQKNAIFNM